ncbi:MAG: RusA family crossover junction endodeoxyribonuclease [Pseudomonadota bacterium]
MDGTLHLIPNRVVSFTVDGLPKGKERPRARIMPGRGGGKPTATIYTPKDTKGFEWSIRRAAMRARGKDPVIDAPVELSLLICLPIAKSLTKRAKADIRHGLSACTKKPDLDNVAKAVIDGLIHSEGKGKDRVHEGLMVDDTQIVRLLVLKDYSETPRVSVRLTELVVPDVPPAQTSSDPAAPEPTPPEDGLVTQGGDDAAEQSKAVKCAAGTPNGIEGAQSSQSLDPTQITRACGHVGRIQDCPRHAQAGADWCDSCRPPGLKNRRRA